ncbi:MAG: acyltransferase [Rikenella sp.]|nr:acyltransferase [Rikenella sp.]
MSSQPLLFPQKPHYEILDGLRGVAALIVVAFHLLEIYATEPLYTVPLINHGYLAVDFFFVLSGFVIGYAYDDRWGRMSLWNFCKRRLIRLQPLVVAGSVIGGLCFYFGAGTMFPRIAEIPLWQLLTVMLAGCFLIPTSATIRYPWHEMFPLNGPAWSLFYEYIGNLLYATVVRRFSKGVLTGFVLLCGAALARLALCSETGSVLGGHELTGEHFTIGMTRILYPFFCGLLLFRTGRRIRLQGGFWIASAVLAAALFFPRVGGETHLWQNGLYEALCILVLFPLIVLAGAGSPIRGRFSVGICRFLGRISFPLYIIHYPFVYLFMAYVSERGLSYRESWPLMIPVGAGCVALAYGLLKLYDEPVRRWLQARFLPHRP